jgi:hypothetical protein
VRFGAGLAATVVDWSGSDHRFWVTGDVAYDDRSCIFWFSLQKKFMPVLTIGAGLAF